jgi:hypothetical protein
VNLIIEVINKGLHNRSDAFFLKKKRFEVRTFPLENKARKEKVQCQG